MSPRGPCEGETKTTPKNGESCGQLMTSKTMKGEWYCYHHWPTGAQKVLTLDRTNPKKFIL